MTYFMFGATMVKEMYYRAFKNSLIIHEDKTKEIHV